MRDWKLQWVAGSLLLAGCLAAGAKTVYVATNSPANGPGTNWTNAFHTIQAAVNATINGDTVMVTNGVYNRGGTQTPGVDHYLTNRVCITNAITVRSVNGSAVTTILGAADPSGTNGPAAVRCAYMENGTLIGFTLTGGHTDESTGLDGRGAGLASLAGLILNCAITGNVSYADGGGVTIEAGSGPGCTLSNCTIKGNVAGGSGGGAASQYGNLSGCTICSNVAQVSGGGTRLDSAVLDGCSVAGNTAWYYGGGIMIGGGDCTIRVSTVASNTAGADGGGVYGGATIERCFVMANSAQGDGGGVWSYGTALIRNTLVTGNVASNATGLGGGGIFLSGSAGEFGTLEQCTVSSNSAGLTGGGLYCNFAGQVTNCIIYFNSAGDGAANWTNVDADPDVCTYGYTCTTPVNGLPGGQGCFTNDPKFLNPAGGDYHLRYGSPCFDAGWNLTAQGVTNDLDGVARPIDGNWDGLTNFDLGCYEYNGWTTDADGDGVLDGAEVVAGTNPTNPVSYFHVVAVSYATTNCRVFFPSATNRSYTLECRTNLVAGQWFDVSGQSNIVGAGGTMSLNGTNASPRFYRVRAHMP